MKGEACFFSDFNEAKSHGFTDSEAYRYAIAEFDGLCYHPPYACDRIGNVIICSICGRCPATPHCGHVKIKTHAEEKREALTELVDCLEWFDQQLQKTRPA